MTDYLDIAAVIAETLFAFTKIYDTELHVDYVAVDYYGIHGIQHALSSPFRRLGQSLSPAELFTLLSSHWHRRWWARRRGLAPLMLVHCGRTQ